MTVTIQHSDEQHKGTTATTHIADTSAAHAASAIAFTPNGTIAATNVQAAIQEVRDEAGAGGTGTGGLLASIAAASAAIANTETVVVAATLPANFMVAGLSFRIRAAGVGTTGLTPGVDTFRIRIGTTTLTGTIPCSVAPPANTSVTAQPFSFEALVTVRTAGAGGTIIGECLAVGDEAATGLFTLLVDLSAVTATVAVDTTATKLLELTFQSGAATSSATFHVATIEGLGTPGTFLTDPMTTAGDTIYRNGSNATTRRMNNDAATVAPTVNEDSGDGYAIGSRWLDTTADLEYVATDVTVGAAVWRRTTNLNYVSIDSAQIAAVTDASTTAVTVAQTSVAELTGIPIGAKYVAVRVLVATSAINATNRLNLHDYGVATGGRTAWCSGVATYFVEFETDVLKLGGTNNRQFDYSIVRGAGTITYYIRVMGYWIASV